MDCQTLQKHLYAYLDGELDPSTLQEVKDHFAACDECATLLLTASSQHALLKNAVSGIRLKEDIAPQVMAQISEAPSPAPVESWGKSLFKWAAIAGVVAFLYVWLAPVRSDIWNAPLFSAQLASIFVGLVFISFAARLAQINYRAINYIAEITNSISDRINSVSRKPMPVRLWGFGFLFGSLLFSCL